MFNSLRPHRVQHVRFLCPSLSPGVCSNSCSLSQWYHPTIICHPLLPLTLIFPSIRVFSKESALLIRWPKYWSFSFSISPSNEYSGLISFRIDWFPLGLTGLIFLLSKGLSRVFSNTTLQKHQFFGAPFFMVQLSHPYMTTGKTIGLTRLWWQSNVSAF